MILLSIPVLGVILIGCAAIYRYIIHPAFISPLGKVPNAHWSAPFSNLWILWIRYKVRENRTVYAAHQALGPVVRLGPSELSVNDVNGLRSIYAGGMEKGEWYSIFDNYGVPCMFSSWHSKPHSVRKRMISHIYSKTTIQTSPALQSQTQTIIYDRLLPKLSSPAAISNVGVDVHSIFNATTMDFITCYLFGLKNGSNFLDDPRERGRWLDLYHSRKTHTFFNQELPRFTKFMRRWGVDLVPRWVDDANAELEDWTMKGCENTKAYLKTSHGNHQNVGDEPVVINAILAGIEKEEKTKGSESVLATETLKYQDKSIASEMIDHLAAGHETSGITLTYIAWYLSQNPRLQDELRAELLNLSPSFKISSNNKDLPPTKTIDALPLLHAIIMETLRLNAAIPGSQPRQTPFPSTFLGPYTIPGGTRVSSAAYTLHRAPSAFPDPEVWDHTRFLNTGKSEQQIKDRDRHFWAFSSGGRMCVGSNFAMQELKMVVAAIWTNFRTVVVDDKGMEQEDGYTCGPVGNRLVLRFEEVV